MHRVVAAGAMTILMVPDQVAPHQWHILGLQVLTPERARRRGLAEFSGAALPGAAPRPSLRSIAG
jgi:hypothetical protein